MRICFRRFIEILALSGVLFGVPLRGQDAAPERTTQGLEQDFLLRVWETADGLLPTTVRAIAQTPDGYVWLAANDGFVRFDGLRAVLFSGKNSAGLPSVPRANRLFVDSAGRLWGASTDGRVYSYDEATWREYGKTQGWDGLVIESITEGPKGRLVFSGANKLFQFAKERFEPLKGPEIPSGFRPPLAATFDAQGRLWIASPTHVWREEGGGWKLVCSSESLHSTLHGLAPSRDSGVWIATSQEVQKFVAEAPVKTLVRPDSFNGEDLVLLEDFHGNLWGGSATKGVRVWMADGRVAKGGKSADSLSPQITCLFEDRERDILAGTDGAGLARFKPRPFAAWFGQLGGLAGALVNSIGEDPPGRILIGTEGSGLRRVGAEEPAGLIVSADGNLGRKQRITTLLRTRDNELLMAIASKGLFRLQGETPVPILAKPLGGELIRALFEDSKGRLWIGHEHGVTVRENGIFRRIQPEATPVLTNVRGIAEDAEGTIWFTGKEGLGRLREGRVELVPLPILTRHPNLLAISVDHEGALWIGAESTGLLRIHHGERFLYTAAHGLPFLSVGAILDEGDYLWASGDKGIMRISHASIEAVAQKKATRLELQLFNRADGLPSDACRRGYQPAAFKASDGQLWFATHKGAIAVNPEKITQSVFEPSATIEEIRVETDLIVVTPANRDGIDVPAGTRHMTIRCAVPSLGKPDYARFQYTLEGFDDVWHDAGGERVIRFYDVQPGRYRFLVRAIGTDGRFVEKPSSVVLIVHPFFWQELWFRSVCLAALIALVALVVWRIQQERIRIQEEKHVAQKTKADLELQLQQAQKMEALGRLAGGIAHDFNNLLTSVGGNAELLLAELPPQSRQRELVNDITAAASRAKDLVSQILTFSRHRPVENTAIDPVPVLRESVQLLRVGLPAMVDLQADVPNTLPPILGDAAQLQRIVMNLGTNAAQAIGGKSGCIRIGAHPCEVKADVPVDGVPSGRYLRLVVSDNGGGMDDRTLSRIFDPFFTTKAVGQGTGMGLSVVHGIVEACGGHITVESQPSVGTVFQIYFPVTDETPAVPEVTTPKPGAAEALPSPAPGVGSNLILLVDDEEVVLKVSRKVLERLGYAVESYPDPVAAADAFAAAPDRYRLLLTDFAMPRLDGVELARRIWAVRPGFPAILYTGYGGRLTPDDVKRMGFAEFLTKPFPMQKLGEVVAAALKFSEPLAEGNRPVVR